MAYNSKHPRSGSSAVSMACAVCSLCVVIVGALPVSFGSRLEESVWLAFIVSPIVSLYYACACRWWLRNKKAMWVSLAGLLPFLEAVVLAALIISIRLGPS